MSSQKRTEEPKIRFRREQRDTMNRMIAGYFNACNRTILLVCSKNPAHQRAALKAQLRLVIDPIPGMSAAVQAELCDAQAEELIDRGVIYFTRRGSKAVMSNGFAAARAAESERYRMALRKEYRPPYRHDGPKRRRYFDPTYA